MPAKKTYKLDLFPLLDNIENKNIEYYDTLSEEALKSFAPFVIMRWLTGCYTRSAKPNMQIYLLNEIVNPYAFGLAKDHKKLLYNLLSISCNAKPQQGNWKFIKVRKKETPMPKAAAIIAEVFGYNKKDASEAIVLLSDADILDMAEQLGKQDTELKEIKKELKAKRPK